jgi:hypothetical protein
VSCVLITSIWYADLRQEVQTDFGSSPVLSWRND